MKTIYLHTYSDGDYIGLTENDGVYSIASRESSFDLVVTPEVDEPLVIANALLDDLGKGWLPYPENKPEEPGEYQVTFIDMVNKNTWVSRANYELYENEMFTLTNNEASYADLTLHPIEIIAYRELPAPYQPKES